MSGSRSSARGLIDDVSCGEHLVWRNQYSRALIGLAVDYVGDANDGAVGIGR